jgi:hypothetical protein
VKPAEAHLVTRCGCERRMAITLPAPPYIELPCTEVGRSMLSTYCGSVSMPEAAEVRMARRVFERDLDCSPHDRVQLYRETRTYKL